MEMEKILGFTKEEWKKALSITFIDNLLYIIMIATTLLLTLIISSKSPCDGQEWDKINSILLCYFILVFVSIKGYEKCWRDYERWKDGVGRKACKKAEVKK